MKQTTQNVRIFFERLAVLALVVSAVVALCDDRPARAANMGVDASTVLSDAAVLDASDDRLDPASSAFEEKASEIRDLLAGKLSSDVAPASLFDVPIDDAAAVGLEEARLERLLERAERDAGRRHHDAGADARPGVMPALWTAREDLDRARLAFYSLSADRRSELLAAQAARIADASQVDEAEHRAQSAERQRRDALEAARVARSEAERVVAEEYARLLDVEAKQSAFEAKLAAGEKAIDEGHEAVLVWQRRAREARGRDDFAGADRLYDQLRGALRTTRNELDDALDAAISDRSDVPRAGPDPLADIGANVDRTQAADERRRVDDAAQRLATAEDKWRAARAGQLLDAIDALNAERLELLPSLSYEKRTSVTGFTGEGADQAASELRQLRLIVRYHRYAAGAWLESLRTRRGDLGGQLGRVVATLIEWLFAAVVFVWLRRRVPLALAVLHKRARQDDRTARLSKPSLPTRLLAFAVQIQRPVLWLVFAVTLAHLLPDEARGLLEVQLASLVLEWTIGGAIVVVTVNAVADAGPAAGAATLRLRSLELVGRVVVAFGLVLVLTSKLVGAGTIHRWVLSTCWIASLPLFLVLVRWWRATIFERAARTRRKTAVDRWIIARQVGWRSFAAATVGAVYFFARGVSRRVRGWASGFHLTRSVLAYLFRRELEKVEAGRGDLASEPIAPEMFAALGPDAPSDVRIETDDRDGIVRLEERFRAARGGVVGLVGGFGMGKSTALRQLAAEFPDHIAISAPLGADETFADDVRARLAAAPNARVVLIDDAERLVRPMMGGLAGFDALMKAASDCSRRTTWLLAIDEALWLFLQRARGSRPLFDDVVRLYSWREEQVASLIRARNAAAELTPSFENLLGDLPSNADDIDRQEALEERATGYFRLVWDYTGGNPGLALHVWRRSLGTDGAGRMHVRFFQAPNASELEGLPDQTVFALRAVLQLGAASAVEIGRATMLPGADIDDALRYATAHGYVDEEAGRFQLTWTWRRAVTLFLQRRHLLVRTGA